MDFLKCKQRTAMVVVDGLEYVNPFCACLLIDGVGAIGGLAEQTIVLEGTDVYIQSIQKVLLQGDFRIKIEHSADGIEGFFRLS